MDLNNPILVTIYQLAGVALIILTAEVIKRRKPKIQKETLRKTIHILLGLWMASWGGYGTKESAVASHILVLLTYLILRYPNPLRSMLRAMYNFVTSAKNDRAVFNVIQRGGVGEISYSLGMLLAVVLSGSAEAYIAAALVLSVADGLAAVVGSRYDKHHIPLFAGGKKTLEGSLAFFITAGLILIVPLGLSINALILAILLTIIELSSRYGEDNLLLPLAIVIAFKFY